MQLSKTSEAQRVFFLLQFTRELLRHSTTYDVKTLEKVLVGKAQQNQEIREKEKRLSEEQLKRMLKIRQEFADLLKEQKKPAPQKPQPMRPSMLSPVTQEMDAPAPMRSPNAVEAPLQGVNIAYHNLPRQLRHIRPQATSAPLDLGELTPFLKDPAVSALECNGPNTMITVKVGRERKKTGLILEKDEIERILQEFSKASRIPIVEGVFRVAIGRVILTAQVSKQLGSKFIITKINL